MPPTTLGSSGRRRLAACVALLVAQPVLAAQPAYGEEPGASPPAPASSSPPSPQAPAPTPPVVRASSSGTWGWYVVASGLVVGAASTTYGLTIDCSGSDLGCQSRASLAIWGGIGIAALASALGIAVVQAGRVQVAPAVTADVFPRAGVVVRGTF